MYRAYKLLIVHLILLVALFNPAHAAWHEASSENFVIYADQSPKAVQEYGERLEKFHSALTAILKGKDRKTSPSNRVTIYVVSQSMISKLYGDGPSKNFVGGFYSSRAGGSIAFVQPFDLSSDQEMDSSQQILFHEYAHHFMFSNSELAFPRWMSEGFAEFYSASKIEKDGSIWVGRPAVQRAYELLAMPDVSIEALFDDEIYDQKKRKGVYDNFYGRSWLLYHYLNIDPERRKLMIDYMVRINSGEAELAAAQAAFGDFKLLNKSLKAYLKQPKISAIKLSPDRVPIKPVTVRRMTEGQDAVMPHRMVSKRGVDEKLAKTILPKIQAVAAKYPADAFVLATLAEAEFDAGNDDAAIAAADKALAIDTKNIDALIQKGYALMRKAQASTADKDWSGVRKHFLSINAVENDHPIPLIYYYRSFVEQGKKPPENAFQGLEWALELAPFDGELRWNLARNYIERKRYADAVVALRPLAFDPHRDNEEAAKLLKEAVEMAANAAPVQPAAP
jgi:tetratricopeptide (TPR) repeat protein